ncbi:MAG: MMPL family transporter [Cellvibrionaceae bacterium]
MKTLEQQKHRWIATFWLCTVLLCGVYCLDKIINSNPFYSNLLELLPEEEKNPILHDLSRLLANRFQQQLFILLKGRNITESKEAAQDLQKIIEEQPLLFLTNNSTDIHNRFIDIYQPFRAQLLPSSYRKTLETHSPETLSNEVLQNLLSPIAPPRPYLFHEDPFNLGGKWLEHLSSNIPFSIQQGYTTVDNWFLITIEITQSPFELAPQESLDLTLEKFRDSHPDIKILTSGMLFHAAAGTKQAKHEIRTVGVGSLIAIVLLALCVFRSLQPLATILITLGASCVVALTTSLLIFEKIHLLTLAFGSTLLGVAVDYIFHFIVKSHQQGSSIKARHTLRYPLAIGALSTICAYLMQLTTPFPGLQQMAIFSASGLAGAWLSIMFWGPLYRAPKSKSTEHALLLFDRIIKPTYEHIRRSRYILNSTLTIGLAVSVITIFSFGANDNIKSLNTSTQGLIDSEKSVQKLLKQPSTNSFFYINENSEQSLIEKLETLEIKLEQTSKEDQSMESLNVQSLAKYIPSIETQTKNFEAVEKAINSKDGALNQLFNRLSLPEKNFPYSLNGNFLTPDKITDEHISNLYPPILSNQGSYQTLLTLDTSKVPLSALEDIAENTPGVRFINQSDDISNLLGRYRNNISLILGLTLLLLTCGLYLRYRAHVLRVICPLLIAITFSLGVASATQGITVFHLMALLLVLGIGIDTAVFYQEVGFNSASWLAASLSCLTSIFAFGLLSLSNIPVLNQFGIIILTGILSCWLIIPIFHLDSAKRKYS